MMMDRAPWQNPRVLVTLLLVFLSGAAAGALVMRYAGPQHRRIVWSNPDGRELSMQKFRKDLDLTPDQARRLETILDDFLMYYQSAQAQMDDVLATGKKRILTVLREDQKQRFEKMIGDLQTRQAR
jgi:hypothetical protein